MRTGATNIKSFRSLQYPNHRRTLCTLPSLGPSAAVISVGRRMGSKCGVFMIRRRASDERQSVLRFRPPDRADQALTSFMQFLSCPLFSPSPQSPISVQTQSEIRVGGKVYLHPSAYSNPHIILQFRFHCHPVTVRDASSQEAIRMLHITASMSSSFSSSSSFSDHHYDCVFQFA